MGLRVALLRDLRLRDEIVLFLRMPLTYIILPKIEIILSMLLYLRFYQGIFTFPLRPFSRNFLYQVALNLSDFWK